MIRIHHNHYPCDNDQSAYDIEQSYVFTKDQSPPHHAPDNGYSFIGVGYRYGQVLYHLLPEDSIDEQSKKKHAVKQKKLERKEFLVCRKLGADAPG